MIDLLPGDQNSSTSHTSGLRPKKPTETNGLLSCRVVIKGISLFILINFLFVWVSPLSLIGSVSVYNNLFPGRLRLPYGDQPDKDYNLSLFNLDAMFASHLISAGPKPENEFRVILIGDSATWGYLLPTDDTLAENLNHAKISLSDGKKVRFYNLGYPVMSLTKDLLILERSLKYDPDMIVWLVTLESFPYDKQLFPPLLQNNPAEVKNLITENMLKLDPDDPQLTVPNWWDRTLIGSRRELADIFRLQLYAPMWAATGIDQDILEIFELRQEDLSAEVEFHGIRPDQFSDSDLAFDVLGAGVQIAHSIPTLIVNEPIFISQGKNSDLRYNFFYPRWAYDKYLVILKEICSKENWKCLDLWDQIPANEFTNTAIHLSPAGSQLLSEKLLQDIIFLAEESNTER